MTRTTSNENKGETVKQVDFSISNLPVALFNFLLPLARQQRVIRMFGSRFEGAQSLSALVSVNVTAAKPETGSEQRKRSRSLRPSAES